VTCVMDDKKINPTNLHMGSQVHLIDVFVGFLKITLSSFGGGLSAWIQQSVVDERKWLTDGEFLSALAVCRILPGPNAVNLAAYIGTQLRGTTGALAALTGLIIIPFLIVLAMGVIYFEFQYLYSVQSALRGMATVAVGMTLGMALKLSLRYSFNLLTVLITVFSFLAIGVFRWSLIPVLAVLIPLSVWLCGNSTNGGEGDK